MNLASILVAAAIAALLVLAVRYLAKHGMCAACEDRVACRKAFQPSGKGKPPASSCGGSCHSCPYYAEEQKMRAAVVPAERRTR